MKIVFNLMNCGLGNNGGSQTIVHSANLLQKLGHDVKIIDTVKNQFTWHPLEVEHVIIKNNKLPETDVIIGTGLHTFLSTANYKNAKKRFHWVRGWETWQMPHRKMVQMFSENKHKITFLTNGIGIKKLLENVDIASYIQYAGIDIYDENITHHYGEELNNEINIGGLINLRHSSKNSEWLIKVLDYLNKLGIKTFLYTYGAKDFKTGKNHIHVTQPTTKRKYKIYKKVDFWLSTSVNEGFHIPPAEYMTTHGVVIGVDSILNGTMSYIINNKTGYLVDLNWIGFAHKIIGLKNQYDNLNIIKDNSFNFIKNNIGSRIINMKKFINLMETI